MQIKTKIIKQQIEKFGSSKTNDEWKSQIPLREVRFANGLNLQKNITTLINLYLFIKNIRFLNKIFSFQIDD